MVIYDIRGEVLLDTEVADTSVRYKAINGDNSLTLKFSIAEHVEVPIGSYCIFKGERYILMLPEDLTMNHRRSFEYTLVMYSEDAKAKRYKFVNPVDGRLKFPLTAKPIEHLQMFVDNMNKRDPGWSVGVCPDHVEIRLSYNHTFCHDALVQLADALELDYWFDGKTVNIGKLELNKDNPLPLSYGGDGEGLKPNIKRANHSALPIDVLYVQGGEQNIDASRYGSSELHLPKEKTIGYDGSRFEDEEGYDSSKARSYKTDENGYFIVRADKEVVNHSEDSIDCSDIVPAKEETIVSVIEVNKEDHFYDIMFSSNVDYSQYVIGGDNASIVFQSGMLAGKEFDLATDDNGNLICKKEGEYWRMEIVPQDIDGITMPDADTGYVPVKDDKFKVFGIQLPDEYVSDDSTKSGAEWDMFRYAVKYLHANEDVQYTISGELDEIYAKRNWNSIQSRLVLGSYISFSDKSFQAEPLLIRITGIKEYVNKPYSPQLEISNAAPAGTLVGALNRIENQEALNDELHRQGISFTKRRFRDAKETIGMIEKLMLNGFTQAISPITVKAMSLLVGDESLQFRFVDNPTSANVIEPSIVYDSASGSIVSAGDVIQHMTIGITDVSPTHSISEYRFWYVDASRCIPAEDDKAYYLYIRASKSSQSASFVLTEDVIGMEEIGGFYHFLTGIVNSMSEGERSIAPLYGYTEVLPGQITTDVLRSGNSKLVIDLANAIITANEGATIEGSLRIGTGSSGLENLSDWKEKQDQIDATTEGIESLNNDISGIHDQIDGVVENWSEKGMPLVTKYPVTQWATDADKIAHINDTYINIEEYVDDYTTPTSGRAWRWCKCGNVTESVVGITREITSSDWEMIGRIDPLATYTTVELFRGGYSRGPASFAFDTEIDLYGGPPVYVKVESATGDVYIKDPSKYFVGYYPIDIRFTYTDSVQVTDKDGNIINLHWHPIADSDAVRALKRVNDFEYLANTFGKSVDVEGAVLAQTLAVKDGDNNVNAMLNGSDLGKDDTCGKLMIAAGIPATSSSGKEDLEDRSKEATTRVYEDGCVYTKNMHLEEGCTIGAYVRTITGGIEIDSAYDGYISLTEENGLFSRCNSMRLYAGGAACNGTMLSVYTEDAYMVCPLEPIPVLVSSTRDAIWCMQGMFGGLRTKTRIITGLGSSEVRNKLDPLEFSVLIDISSGTCYLKLPSMPYDGQEYIIESYGAGLNVVASNPMLLINAGTTISKGSAFTYSGKSVVRFKYYDDFAQWTISVLTPY